MTRLNEIEGLVNAERRFIESTGTRTVTYKFVNYCDELIQRVRELEADQSDWRKGVELIASALGVTGPGSLSCVGLAEKALEIRAELETLRDMTMGDDL